MGKLYIYNKIGFKKINIKFNYFFLTFSFICNPNLTHAEEKNEESCVYTDSCRVVRPNSMLINTPNRIKSLHNTSNTLPDTTFDTIRKPIPYSGPVNLIARYAPPIDPLTHLNMESQRQSELLDDNNRYIAYSLDKYMATGDLKYAKAIVDHFVDLKKMNALTIKPNEQDAKYTIAFRADDFSLALAAIKDIPELLADRSDGGYYNKIKSMLSWYDDIAKNAYDTYHISGKNDVEGNDNISSRFGQLYIANGVINGNDEQFQRGIRRYVNSLKTVGGDGSLKDGRTRGLRSLVYQNAGTMAPVFMAAWAATQGVDLFKLKNENNGLTIHDIAHFSMDSMENSSLYRVYTSESQNSLAPTPDLRSSLRDVDEVKRWIEIYSYFFPQPVAGDLMKSAGKYSVGAYRYPYHAGGNSTLMFAPINRIESRLNGKQDGNNVDPYFMDQRINNLSGNISADWIGTDILRADAVHGNTDNHAVSISGKGTHVELSQFMAVGYVSKNSSLDIKDGGVLHDFNGYIGYFKDASGTTNLIGPRSKWNNDYQIYIGNNGTGTLNILNGGQLNSVDSVIGRGTTGSGEVLVKGKNSSFHSQRSMTIGEFGIGELTVSEGGIVSVRDDNLQRNMSKEWGIRIAPFPGSVGVVNIGGKISPGLAGTLDADFLQLGANSAIKRQRAFGEGQAYLNFNHKSDNYIFHPNIIGTGHVNLLSGNTTLSGTNTFSGDININGGRLTITDKNQVEFIKARLNFDKGSLVLTSNTKTSFNAPVIVNGYGEINTRKNASLKITNRISGHGTLYKKGPGTVLFAADAKTSDVNYVISNGLINGSLNASSLKVLGDGVFEPTGLVSIKNYAYFGPGSRLNFNVSNIGSSGLILSQGTVLLDNNTLDVSLKMPPVNRLQLENMTSLIGKSYKLLEAQEGISGHFGAVETNSLFMMASPEYKSDGVLIKIKRNKLLFEDIAETSNEKSVAAAVDHLNQGHPVYESILTLDTKEVVKNALRNLSGQIYADVSSAQMNESRYVRDAAIDRLRQTDGYLSLSGIKTNDKGVWVNLLGNSVHGYGNKDVAGFNTSTYGVLLGIDRELKGRSRVGIMTGYTRTSINASYNSSAQSDNYHLGIYGDKRFNALTMRMGSALTWHRTDSSRQVRYSQQSDNNSAKYNGQTGQVFIETGYNLTENIISVEPFANFSYTFNHSGGFRESGRGASLQAESRDLSATNSTLGVRSGSTIKGKNMTISFNSEVGWQHQYDSLDRGAQLAFRNSDSGFNIESIKASRDGAVLKAGADIFYKKKTVFSVSYSTMLSKNYQDNRINIGVALHF